jgi:hypothetical protein
MLVSIHNPDLTIRLQCEVVTYECDKLVQEDEFVFKSDSVKPDAEHVLEIIVGSVDSLAVINTVYSSNDWNLYIKNIMIHIPQHHTKIVHLKMLVKHGIIQMAMDLDVISKMKYR